VLAIRLLTSGIYLTFNLHLKHLPLFICTGFPSVDAGEAAVLLVSAVEAGEAIEEAGALLTLGSSGDGLRRCFLDFSILGIIFVSSTEIEGAFILAGIEDDGLL
jgi:hypothetical protein